MAKSIIEREIPGPSQLTVECLKRISKILRGILKTMEPQIQWVQSFVTTNKVHCLYIAPSESMVREHTRLGHFPANVLTPVSAIIVSTAAGS